MVVSGVNRIIVAAHAQRASLQSCRARAPARCIEGDGVSPNNKGIRLRWLNGTPRPASACRSNSSCPIRAGRSAYPAVARRRNPFRPVNTEYRQSLTRQIAAIRDTTLPQMKEVGVAPVRVKLLTKAAAKSHRPESLFSDKTCPSSAPVGWASCSLRQLPRASGALRPTSLRTVPLLLALQPAFSSFQKSPAYSKNRPPEAYQYKNDPQKPEAFVHVLTIVHAAWTIGHR